MKSSIALLVILAPAVASAPVPADSQVTMASEATLEEVASPFDEYVIPIPEQTMRPWRGEEGAIREARNLETYLQILVWGRDGVAAAQAEGRSITVEPGGLVIVRDSRPNVERVRREINPSLEATLRRRASERTPGDVQRVTQGTVTTDPNARVTGIRVVGEDAPSASTGGTRPVGSSSFTARRTLQYDDEMTFRGLRLTLLDVHRDAEVEERLVAVLLAETTDSSDELEIMQERSANFEGFRIRVLEAEVAPDREVTIEVTDMNATSR